MCKGYCSTKEVQQGNRAVGVLGKFWPQNHKIKVFFIGGTQKQRHEVVDYSSAILMHTNLSLVFTEQKHSDIRISFDENDGAWSYIGTDAKGIPKSRATMNLGWIDKATVMHEFGHAIGLVHEHSNPNNPIRWNVDAVKKDLMGAPNYWSEYDIEYNVFMKYDPKKVIATERDNLSIMMYPFPSDWTIEGESTPFNEKLSYEDIDFLNNLYPKKNPTTPKKEVTGLDVIKALTDKDLFLISEITIVQIGLMYSLDVSTSYAKLKNFIAIKSFIDEKTIKTYQNGKE